mmetsp:Transcript_29684/g.90832  ORF Transcript_29684/g.90832 Transcript_29684/m.90832 type:complete len:248 (+) Transcript_29684:185-928(+)
MDNGPSQKLRGRPPVVVGGFHRRSRGRRRRRLRRRLLLRRARGGVVGVGVGEVGPPWLQRRQGFGRDGRGPGSQAVVFAAAFLEEAPQARDFLASAGPFSGEGFVFLEDGFDFLLLLEAREAGVDPVPLAEPAFPVVRIVVLFLRRLHLLHLLRRRLLGRVSAAEHRQAHLRQNLQPAWKAVCFLLSESRDNTTKRKKSLFLRRRRRADTTTSSQLWTTTADGRQRGGVLGLCVLTRLLSQPSSAAL